MLNSFLLSSHSTSFLLRRCAVTASNCVQSPEMALITVIRTGEVNLCSRQPKKTFKMTLKLKSTCSLSRGGVSSAVCCFDAHSANQTLTLNLPVWLCVHQHTLLSGLFICIFTRLLDHNPSPFLFLSLLDVSSQS